MRKYYSTTEGASPYESLTHVAENEGYDVEIYEVSYKLVGTLKCRDYIEKPKKERKKKGKKND